MLNEVKIKLMTRVAIYEKTEERNGLLMSKYFKEDYVKFGCLRTLVLVTICYWLIVGIYVATNFDKLLTDINNMDYFKLMSIMLSGYVGVAAVFYVYSFIVFSFRYYRARPGIVEYNKNLKKIIKLYEVEEREFGAPGVAKTRVYSNIGGDFDDLPQDGEVQSQKIIGPEEMPPISDYQDGYQNDYQNDYQDGYQGDYQDDYQDENFDESQDFEYGNEIPMSAFDEPPISMFGDDSYSDSFVVLPRGNDFEEDSRYTDE